MARYPKCPDCDADITDKKKAKKVSNRWVCEACQGSRDALEVDRQTLYSYIAKLFDMDFPNGWMMKQVKDFKERHGYTYKGMQMTLEYWTETLGNSMHDAKGVGIIPYIYDEAKELFMQKRDVKYLIETMEEPLTTDRFVSVSRGDIETKRFKNKIIDMDDL